MTVKTITENGVDFLLETHGRSYPIRIRVYEIIPRRTDGDQGGSPWMLEVTSLPDETAEELMHSVEELVRRRAREGLLDS